MRRRRSKQLAYAAKSLQELEQSHWGPVGAGETPLIRECLRLRKVPLARLANEDLRLLIGQEIGLKYLVPLALERLKANPWLDALYPGDLLAAVLRVPPDFWRTDAALLSSALKMGRDALAEWERLEEGQRSLSGFRSVKRCLAELERGVHDGP